MSDEPGIVFGQLEPQGEGVAMSDNGVVSFVVWDDPPSGPVSEEDQRTAREWFQGLDWRSTGIKVWTDWVQPREWSGQEWAEAVARRERELTLEFIDAQQAEAMKQIRGEAGS